MYHIAMWSLCDHISDSPCVWSVFLQYDKQCEEWWSRKCLDLWFFIYVIWGLIASTEMLLAPVLTFTSHHCLYHHLYQPQGSHSVMCISVPNQSSEPCRQSAFLLFPISQNWENKVCKALRTGFGTTDVHVLMYIVVICSEWPVLARHSHLQKYWINKANWIVFVVHRRHVCVCAQKINMRRESSDSVFIPWHVTATSLRPTDSTIFFVYSLVMSFFSVDFCGHSATTIMGYIINKNN